MANSKGNEASLVKYQPKWQSGKTKTIRVPIAITDQLLDIAKSIDNGTYNTVTSDSSFNKNEVKSLLESILTSSNKRQMKELTNKLGNLLGFRIKKVGKNWQITCVSD